MFTVLSNSRNTNLYLIIALAIMVVVFLAFTVVPSIAAPKPALIPVTGASEYADYYQRHSDLRLSTVNAFDMTADFYQRHPEWISNVQIAAVPMTGVSESSDYFTRHPELLMPNTTIDLSDYFQRH